MDHVKGLNVFQQSFCNLKRMGLHHASVILIRDGAVPVLEPDAADSCLALYPDASGDIHSLILQRMDHHVCLDIRAQNPCICGFMSKLTAVN